jgi:AcrR family transcriptional regulator
LETAALTLFAEGGLSAVNFDQVAKQAGVSRTALYRRWATREDLVAAALLRYRSVAEQGLENWADRSLNEILDIFAEQTAAVSADPFARKLIRQLYALGERDTTIKQAYWSTIVEPRRKAFTAIIRQAQRRGQINPNLNPEIMQDMLSGAIAYRLLAHPDDTSIDGMRAYVKALLLAAGFRT